MHSKGKHPLRLSALAHRHELQELVRSGKLTHDVELLVRRLVGARLYQLKLPRIDSPALLAHAKHYLDAGVVIKDRDGKERRFDVMVFVPDNPATSAEKPRAILVPRFPGGHLFRLSEIRTPGTPFAAPVIIGME